MSLPRGRGGVGQPDLPAGVTQIPLPERLTGVDHNQRSFLVPRLRQLAMLGVALALAGCSDDGPTPADTAAPSASPTGSSSEPPPPSGPSVVFQAGGGVRLLVPGEDVQEIAPQLREDKQHPDWSPDGTTLSFDSNFTTVWTAIPDEPATELSGCVEPCANVFDGAWSPGGSEVAFVRILGDGVHTTSAQVVAVDVATGQERVLTEDTAGDVWLYGPRWSSDGSHLLVERDQFASTLLDEDTVIRQDLAVIDVGTGDLTIQRGTRGATDHDWSPVDDLIVFELHGNLVTMRADGSGRSALTDFDTATESALQPTFTPDGTGVMFTWVHGIPGSGNDNTASALMTLADHEVVEIDGTSGATHPRLRPAD